MMPCMIDLCHKLPTKSEYERGLFNKKEPFM